MELPSPSPEDGKNVHSLLNNMVEPPGPRKYCTVNFLNIRTPQKVCCNHSKIWSMWLYHRVMSPNDADRMANSVDPDQTAPWTVMLVPGQALWRYIVRRYQSTHGETNRQTDRHIHLNNLHDRRANYTYWEVHMGRVKRIWYLPPMRAAMVQASLRIHAVSLEPPLLTHTSSESRGTFRQKARSLAPLNGWACAVKICHDRMLKDTNSLDGAHMFLWSLL